MDVLAAARGNSQTRRLWQWSTHSAKRPRPLLRFVRFAETCPRIGRSLITNIQSACSADDAVERPCAVHRECIVNCRRARPMNSHLNRGGVQTIYA